MCGGDLFVNNMYVLFSCYSNCVVNFSVKSFGTENRPTEHPVPARDEIYEFIIFKASDIKDLIVCETPKPVPQQ